MDIVLSFGKLIRTCCGQLPEKGQTYRYGLRRAQLKAKNRRLPELCQLASVQNVKEEEASVRNIFDSLCTHKS